MPYWETLPPNCPANDSQDRELTHVYRLVPTIDITVDHFKSYAALGKENKTKIDPCRWASCSLVKDPEKHLSQWPRLRLEYKFAAKLYIPNGAGKSYSKKLSNHIDFWCFDNFDIRTAIEDVVCMEKGDDDDPA